MKHLPFEKLYRGRYVHVLSQFGATYSGFVTNRCSSDKIVHVVDETGERCSVDGRFLKAYSNRRALRAATDTIKRRLLTAGEMARKHIAEMERSRNIRYALAEVLTDKAKELAQPLVAGKESYWEPTPVKADAPTVNNFGLNYQGYINPLVANFPYGSDTARLIHEGDL